MLYETPTSPRDVATTTTPSQPPPSSANRCTTLMIVDTLKLLLTDPHHPANRCIWFTRPPTPPPMNTTDPSGVEGVEGAGEDADVAAMPPVHHSKSVSYTHLRAHETPEHLVCRLLLEKKKIT
eukprot:TRINITY_DN39781_c0_g1_i1.p1 TRINITY_DN39781_c0_g1~~TRINITY_DN39781_c0_g1_i1.p1  ORF type:complete len:123 (+),score=28.70 TRINITY_DN39781_c0_g1_i1:200-568(+)